MALSYLYCSVSYATEAEAQAAVVSKKNELDTSPSTWVTVKPVTASGSSGWVIGSDALSDEEINNLDASATYCVFCSTNGENHMPMTASEVTAKVSELRSLYAASINVDKMYSFEFNNKDVPILEVTLNEDMSVYV